MKQRYMRALEKEVVKILIGYVEPKQAKELAKEIVQKITQL